MNQTQFNSKVGSLRFPLDETVGRQVRRVLQSVRSARGRGAPARRERCLHVLTNVSTSMLARSAHRSGPDPRAMPYVTDRERRYRAALWLAKMSRQYYDEHGSAPGDYRTTKAIDFVPSKDAVNVPYCDMGGAGIGLISIERVRIYSQWRRYFRPSVVREFYLVGRNESGTYWAHAVAPTTSVWWALDWVWGGRSLDIIQRQGDIALIEAPGPKLPAGGLPPGHEVDQAAGVVRHATHPPLPLPGKGQRIIVGLRAKEKVSMQTRD